MITVFDLLQGVVDDMAIGITFFPQSLAGGPGTPALQEPTWDLGAQQPGSAAPSSAMPAERQQVTNPAAGPSSPERPPMQSGPAWTHAARRMGSRSAQSPSFSTPPLSPSRGPLLGSPTPDTRLGLSFGHSSSPAPCPGQVRLRRTMSDPLDAHLRPLRKVYPGSALSSPSSSESPLEHGVRLESETEGKVHGGLSRTASGSSWTLRQHRYIDKLAVTLHAMTINLLP